MSNSNSGSNSGPKNPFLKFLMIIAALTVMPVYELGKALSKEAYKGWKGIFVGLLGFGAGIAGGIGAAELVGWHYNLSVLLWMPAGLVGFLLTTFIVWPAFYLYLAKPAWNFGEWVLDRAKDFSKGVLAPVADGFVNVLKYLPGAGLFWNTVKSEEKKTAKAHRLVTSLFYIAGFGLSLYTGYLVYSLLLPLVPAWFTGLPQAAAGFVAIVSWAISFGILNRFNEYGKQSYQAVAASIVGVYFLAPLTASLVAGWGLGTAGLWGVYAVEFLLGVAYVFSGFYALLLGGFLKAVLQGIKKLLDSTYDEEDKDYRKFFHQVVNILVAGGVGYLGYLLVAALSLPFALGVVAFAIAAFISYAIGFEVIDHSGGNAMLSGLASATAGGFAVYGTLASGWGTIIGCAIAAAVGVFVLVFPLFYQLIRVLTSGFATGAGKALTSPQEACEKGLRKVSDKIGDLCKLAYEDKSKYRDLFLHLTNIAIVVFALFNATPFVSGFLGMTGILYFVVAAIGAYLVYLLLGKALIGFDTDAVGLIAGVAAGVYVGNVAWGVNPSWLVAVPSGIIAFIAASALVFPVLYVIVKAIANPLLTGWLEPLVTGLYKFVWSTFEGLWNGFVAVYKVVFNFIAPWFGWFFRGIAAIWNSIREAWESFRGKR